MKRKSLVLMLVLGILGSAGGFAWRTRAIAMGKTPLKFEPSQGSELELAMDTDVQVERRVSITNTSQSNVVFVPKSTTCGCLAVALVDGKQGAKQMNLAPGETQVFALSLHTVNREGKMPLGVRYEWSTDDGRRGEEQIQFFIRIDKGAYAVPKNLAFGELTNGSHKKERIKFVHGIGSRPFELASVEIAGNHPFIRATIVGECARTSGDDLVGAGKCAEIEVAVDGNVSTPSVEGDDSLRWVTLRILPKDSALHPFEIPISYRLESSFQVTPRQIAAQAGADGSGSATSKLLVLGKGASECTVIESPAWSKCEWEAESEKGEKSRRVLRVEMTPQNKSVTAGALVLGGADGKRVRVPITLMSK